MKILQMIKKIIGNKNILTNIYWIQAHNSILFGWFFIGFINCILKGNSLLDYKCLFFPTDYEKNDRILQKYFP